MKQVPIKRAIEGVPGGRFTGALPILAVFFVCTGASIDFRATPYILKKGGACSPSR